MTITISSVIENTICDEIIATLEQEYLVIKNAQFDSLFELNQTKTEQLARFDLWVQNIHLSMPNLPHTIDEKLVTIQKASQRNAAALSGAIEGTKLLMNALKQAQTIATSAGCYDAQGNNMQTDLVQTNLGSV
jgi:flagellar biosynthesis/type III secretory pathway chaperone